MPTRAALLRRHSFQTRLVAASLLSALSLPSWVRAQTATAAPELALKFSQFFRQPVGPRGLELSPALQDANGRMVRLVGYMVAQEEPAAGRLLLTPLPVRMSEHADGDADELPPATVSVLLDDSQRDRVVAHQPGLITLTGRLVVGRVEDAAGRVSWVRLHLSPQALAERQVNATAAVPNQIH